MATGRGKGGGGGAAGEPGERTCWKGDRAGRHLLLPEQLGRLAVGAENPAEAATRRLRTLALRSLPGNHFPASARAA